MKILIKIYFYDIRDTDLTKYVIDLGFGGGCMRLVTSSGGLLPTVYYIILVIYAIIFEVLKGIFYII